MTPSNKLVQLFAEMAALTAPECATNCKLPHTCCSPEYCDMTEQIAVEQGVTLEIQSHPTLKYMSPTGCIVSPHLRPLCTLHTCAINAFGFKPGDPSWTKRYFRLRTKIERAYVQSS